MAVNISFAQGYYQSPNDTIIADAPFDDFSVFNIFQIHPGTDTLYFKWHKESVEMPVSWEAGICDNGECNNFLKDSGMMIPIVPGDNGLMSLHINPHTEAGTAIIRYSIFETHNPQQVDTLSWIIAANAVPNGITASGTNSQPRIFTEGKKINCLSLNGHFSKALIFDLQGRLLSAKSISGNEARLNIPEISAQMLILQLIGNQTLTRKLFYQSFQ